MSKTHLEDLNQEVRNATAALHGRVNMQCKEATEKLVVKADGELIHYAGFYGWETHNWAVDITTGDIYDPTIEQFTNKWLRVVKNGSEEHKQYLGTTQDEVQYWAPDAISMVDISHLARYLQFKQNVGRPIEKRGYSQTVEKIANNGKKYLLIQNEVQFTSLKRKPQLRSATIWQANRGGHNAYVLTQGCVESETGKIIFPVKRIAYYIPQNLNGLVPIRKGKCQEVVKPAFWEPLAEVVRAAKDWH